MAEKQYRRDAAVGKQKSTRVALKSTNTPKGEANA